MASKTEYHQEIIELKGLAKEDQRFSPDDDPEFLDHPQSRDPFHHQGYWAGSQQLNFGAHRRGPSSRHR